MINDNFNEIIDIEGFNKSSNENNDDNNEAFIIQIPNKTQLNKMKKDELIELCKQFNKNINISKPTKKDLIDIILQ